MVDEAGKVGGASCQRWGLQIWGKEVWLNEMNCCNFPFVLHEALNEWIFSPQLFHGVCPTALLQLTQGCRTGVGEL